MRRRQETVTERLYRLRGVIFVVSVPLLLILTVLALMPRSSPYDYSTQPEDPLDHKGGVDTSSKSISAGGGEGEKYAVIIDCGSSGSRIHVYRFNSEMDLLEIKGELELFIAIKPGVSSYKDTPKEAGESLRQLLDKAKEVIPPANQKMTPIKVGATAGLRMVGQEIADSILDEIRKVLEEYPFSFEKDSVSILEGSMEGSFAWMSINYLLGKLGKPYGETVGVVDLGGGSVQMTYAISEKSRSAAPTDKDIVEVTGKGRRYNIFVHSFLNYGLLAFRAELLKLGATDGNPCVAEGFKGEYEYPSRSGTTYKAEAREEGAAFKACKSMVVKALELEKPCGIEGSCSFAGVWNGGAGAGLKSLYVLSFFFDRAVQVGIIKDPEASTATVTVSDFSQAAESACKLSVSNVAATYPLVDDGKAEDPKDAQYLCLDLTYCAALLKDGFGFKSSDQITLVKKISYQQKDVEAQWSLGAAINALG